MRNLPGFGYISMDVSRRSSLHVAVATPEEPTVRAPLRERLRREMAAGMLLAAEEVFAESGLSKAHVEDIARRAGVAVGTLYNYYKDRDALLAATLTARVEELRTDFAAVTEKHTRSPARSMLLELSRAYLAFVVRRRTFMRILVAGELAQLSDSYPTSAAIPSQCWQSFRDVFAAAIARGVAEGELPATADELDVWLFMGLLRGVVMRDIKAGVACRVEDAERVVAVFFDGARL